MSGPYEYQTYLILSLRELKYLEACIFVADSEGEHSDEFGVDQVDIGNRIRKRIEELA